jgi:hypothetical protein
MPFSIVWVSPRRGWPALGSVRTIVYLLTQVKGARSRTGRVSIIGLFPIARPRTG